MKLSPALLLTIFLGPLTLPLSADVTLPPIFSDHMVLQKTGKVPVWGRAEAGEKVTVTLNGVSVETTAGTDQRWKVSLDLEKSGPGPFEMTVQGKNQIRIADVVIGEVWLASGQSNMAWQMKATTVAPDFYAKSSNSMLREFTVDRVTSREPTDTYQGKWIVAGPDTTPNFSAVAYYFGSTLQTDLKVPVGLVNSSWGGTPSEAWTRQEAIDRIPGIAEHRAAQLKETDDFAANQAAFVTAFSDWLKANGREDQPAGAEAFLQSDAKWTAVELPEGLKKAVTGPGVVWLRREVNIPAAEAGRALWIELSLRNAYDTVYWNGKAVGGLSPAAFPLQKRGYSVPAAEVREGKNTLAIRLFAPASAVPIVGPPRFLKESQPDGWQYAIERTFPALAKEKEAAAPQPPPEPLRISNVASQIYNGMIHPLLSYAIRGAIWYQGENNAERAKQYGTAFPLMIEDWRAQWGQGPFPFYFCQLAAYQAKKNVPGESLWSELREAQSQALKLPNTGQAVLIDIGEAGDIHPRNKRDVGHRLAQIALARDYGRAVPFSGPVYQSMKVEGGKIVLTFGSLDGGLVAQPLPATHIVNSTKNQTEPLVPNSPKSQLEGFSICGQDRKWVWADAKIEGDQVIVWADQIPNPVAVRYAWATNPNTNLYNGADFPASPFRTDDFPGLTDGKGY